MANYALVLFVAVSAFVQSNIDLGKVQITHVEIGNLIEWESAKLGPEEFYVIQRSDDGIKFSDISKIPTENKNGKTPYFFLDRNFGENRNFYRLKVKGQEMEQDIFSEIILTERNSTKPFKVTNIKQTRTDKLVEFSFKAMRESNFQIVVEDDFEDVVYQEDIFAFIGKNDLKIELGEYPIGRYTVKLMQEGEVDSFTVEKVFDEALPKLQFASGDY